MAQIPRIRLPGRLEIPTSKKPDYGLLRSEGKLSFEESINFYINEFRDEISDSEKYSEYITFLKPELQKLKSGRAIDENLTIKLIKDLLKTNYKYLFSDLEFPSEIESLNNDKENLGRFAAFLNAALENINKQKEEADPKDEITKDF